MTKPITFPECGFVLIEESRSAFAKRETPKSGGRFYEAVKAAMDNPGKAVVIDWPEDLNWGQILSQLDRASKLFPYKLRTSCRKKDVDLGIRQEGTFQIIRGDARVDVGEPEIEYKVASAEVIPGIWGAK